MLTAEVALTDERYSDEADRIAFYLRATQEIAAIPGVEAVGTVYPLPLFSRRVSTVAQVEGGLTPESESQRPLVDLRFVTPGYLGAAGLELTAGRFVEASDTADSPPVVVVNESFVRQLCPRGDIVGRRTTGYDPSDPEAEWETIVGVVRNVRHIDLADDAGPEMYVPVTQFGFEWATFAVRARTDDAMSLADPIREIIHRLDPELPVFNVQTMAEVVGSSLARTRVVTALLVLFASVGLALAGIGVFSVISFTVGRRLHEVAVRLALGGTPGRIVALIVRQGLVPVAAGLLCGIAAAFVLTRVLASHLYGVASHDPLTFSGTAVVVFAVSLLATWLPTRRAAQVEPMTVLRNE